MKDLFYSVLDKKLFLIVGYTDESRNVKSKISMLQNNANFFLTQTKLPKSIAVNTLLIDKSSRYKSMRVFYAENVEPENVTTDAFFLGAENGWTMEKWISN